MARSRAAPIGLVLGPGASATREHTSLVAIETSVTALLPDAVVERVDLPKRAEAAVGVVAERAAAMAEKADTVVLGGRSFGGRVASMAAAGGARCDALVCISYPLHPPGRPDQLRVAHLPDLRVPSLFISGTRDAFGTVDELTSALHVVPGPLTLRWIDGGDHGLRRHEALVAAVVADWIAGLR